MRMTIVRSRLVRDACQWCAALPGEGNALWTCITNDASERIGNICPACSSTMAHAYLKQLAQQQAGTNNAELLVAPAPPFMTRGARRRRE